MEKSKIETIHLECIKEDNSADENSRQWDRSKIVFDEFYSYLKEKGLKESTCSKRADEAAFFIMTYLFVYSETYDMRDVDDIAIRTYLGNWYIRKFWNPSLRRIKSQLRSISDFYSFLHSLGFIDSEDLREIKNTCKDIAWFEMRLKTYFEADGENFREWLDEYDYGF